LQAGRQIRGLAEGQLLLPGTASHVPHDDQAGVDAQARCQAHPPLWFQARRELPQGFEYPEPGPHGPLRVIFVCQRVAEVNQQAIAEVLGDMAFKAGNHLGAGVLIGAHDFPELFGVKLRRERGRADQVTKQHGELAPFSVRDLGCADTGCDDTSSGVLRHGRRLGHRGARS
jgi:hypothetical protein